VRIRHRRKREKRGKKEKGKRGKDNGVGGDEERVEKKEARGVGQETLKLSMTFRFRKILESH